MALTLGASEPATPIPPTERIDVTDTMHGERIVDPYRWLEGADAPEIEDDPDLDAKVSKWTDAQNAYTRSVLDALPGRSTLHDRMRELMEMGSVSAPSMRLNRYFFWKREGDQSQSILYVQMGHDGEPRVLVNPNELDPDGLLAPAWSTPSPDGSLLAFGLYRAGDENATLHLLSVDSGEWLADEIPGKVNSVAWTPDGRSFFYSRLADLKNPYSRQIKFHKVGTHHRQDPILFEQYKEGPLATTWGPNFNISSDARWLILGYWTGTDSNDLWVVDLDQWFRTGEFARKEIVVGEDATSGGPVIGDTLYMRTTLDASNGRVMAVNLHEPDRGQWKELIPEREDAVLTDIDLSRSFLIADYLKNAATEMVMFRLDGEPVKNLELPGIGSAGIATHEDRNEAFLTFTSFSEPASIYRIDLDSGERSLWARPEAPVDPSVMEVTQLFFSSKDGTKIPMFVAHKKGLELNGSNPTILTGYGGFNISRTPSFNATLFPWLERGGVYALVNLRGGGEYGEDWHRAGMLDQKQNVFDDFIAAAEFLIEKEYTNPKKLGIQGGSNGGLLTGAAVTQRPELFAAVISAVPLLDMLRYQHFLMARYWVPEYGDADQPDQFPYLRAYSPYHNVKKGTAYPAILLTAGENDARVHALHARKMAALLQASTASDPSVDPVLLWVDRSAGHGQGKPLDLRVRDVVDQYAFMMWQLGMLPQSEQGCSGDFFGTTFSLNFFGRTLSRGGEKAGGRKSRGAKKQGGDSPLTAILVQRNQRLHRVAAML